MSVACCKRRWSCVSVTVVWWSKFVCSVLLSISPSNLLSGRRRQLQVSAAGAKAAQLA